MAAPGDWGGWVNSGKVSDKSMAASRAPTGPYGRACLRILSMAALTVEHLKVMAALTVEHANASSDGGPYGRAPKGP